MWHTNAFEYCPSLFLPKPEHEAAAGGKVAAPITVMAAALNRWPCCPCETLTARVIATPGLNGSMPQP